MLIFTSQMMTMMVLLMIMTITMKENPAIRDRLKMILKNPRLLDLMSIIIFSTAFFLYVFDYWVITNHDNDYDD